MSHRVLTLQRSGRRISPQKESKAVAQCRLVDVRLLALVALGGAIGASLRYVVQSSFDTHSGPYATITVNLLGSLLLGMMFGAMSAGMTVSEGVIAILATGVLGSFTTMSAFAMDYVEFSDSSISSAIVYLLVTIIGSIGLAMVGYRSTMEILS